MVVEDATNFPPPSSLNQSMQSNLAYDNQTNILGDFTYQKGYAETPIMVGGGGNTNFYNERLIAQLIQENHYMRSQTL